MKSLDFLYAVVGEGTKLLSKLKQGDTYKLIGPLGNGFNIEEYKRKGSISIWRYWNCTYV